MAILYPLHSLIKKVNYINYIYLDSNLNLSFETFRRHKRKHLDNKIESPRSRFKRLKNDKVQAASGEEIMEEDILNADLIGRFYFLYL